MLVDDMWKDTVRLAWDIQPRLAVQMPSRFKLPVVEREVRSLIANNTLDVVNDPEALVILLGDKLAPSSRLNLKHLQYWSPVAPITATSYFSPAYNNHPLVLQYAMRTLEYYPVDTVFFYVPQVVQALRSDDLGYVERYIMEAGSVSQLFAHQIIWNMKANFFVDADKECLKPDVLKPSLERIIYNLVESFTGEDKEFYQREFKFFGEVTAISGYLKEYIKYGQNEKKPMQKKRLDEEMAKIEVDVGVYLPSNPEGRVVDINRTSGRPLQSHAKAPFMATFMIEKEVEEVGVKKTLVADNGSIGESEDGDKQTMQVWQGAIFKVGDDCRQDVLALQLIAVFKNIFTNVGLDLYVYPYRVVATAPGCGVIDVIPRSISRDQLGREKVNSMYDYFIAKYGGEDSIEFQQARINFVQSVAAYSVISYLLQIKDRHNGNIMLDDDGHIIHIGELPRVSSAHIS
jgi:phosphatidylinositol 4-kinase